MEKTIRYRIIYFFILILSLSSCQKRPEGVVDDNAMTNLLVDLYLADSYIRTNSGEFSNDSSKKVLRQSILNKHNISQYQLDTSLDWYGRHIDEYVNLYDNVQTILEKKESQYRHIAGIESGIQNESIFKFPSMRMLLSSDIGDGYYFSFQNSGEISKGDRITLQYRLIAAKNNFESLIGVEYEDGANSYILQKNSGPGKNTVILQTDSNSLTSRIYGWIRSSNSFISPVWIDSISITQTPLNTETYHRIHSQKNFPANISQTKNIISHTVEPKQPVKFESETSLTRN